MLLLLLQVFTFTAYLNVDLKVFVELNMYLLSQFATYYKINILNTLTHINY